MRTARAVLLIAAAALAAGVLSGCSFYDYLNHDDTVTLRAGDSVKANLERSTINPSKRSMYKVHGLGADGDQIPEDEEAEAAQ
jgi:hypothetical protein